MSSAQPFDDKFLRQMGGLRRALGDDLLQENLKANGAYPLIKLLMTPPGYTQLDKVPSYVTNPHQFGKSALLNSTAFITNMLCPT